MSTIVWVIRRYCVYFSVDNPLPSLPDHLRHNDVCTFEAEAQAERNGSKWRAIDGSVKVIRQAETINGEGTITKLDETNGQFGFIRSPIGDVFFNASSVRPIAKSITTVLKAGQCVRFTAIKGAAQQRNNTVQLRAVMVCARNYRPPSDIPVNVKATLRESNLTKAALKSMTSDTTALNGGTRGVFVCLRGISEVVSLQIPPLERPTRRRRRMRG